MYAYQLKRPEHYANLRNAASEPSVGMTAVVDDKPYLVLGQTENGEFVLEGEDGKMILQTTFDHAEATEHNSLVAASRLNDPFRIESKIGDWQIGNIAFVEGNWHIRNGDSDEVVPLENLVQMLEDSAWFKQAFNSNFKVHLTNEEKTASLKKKGVVIEGTQPRHGWHNRCMQAAHDAGLDGTITWPDGEVTGLQDGQTFMKLMMTGMQMGARPGEFDSIPVTWDVSDPDTFWQIYNDPRLGGGTNEVTASVLPDTPLEHSLDTMKVVADRSDYEHWNEDADYMWWNEEGKHPYEPDYNSDMDEEYGALDAVAEEGYEAANDDINLAELVPPYDDQEANRVWMNAFIQGRHDNGGLVPTPSEISTFLGYDPQAPNSEERAFNAMGNLQKGSPYPENSEKNAPDHSAPGHNLPDKVNDIYNAIMREHPGYGKEKAMKIAWERSGLHKEKDSSWTRVAVPDLATAPGGVPQDIPFDPAIEQNVVHAFEDGDIVLQDGTTTYDPARAYGFLIGQHEFDKAKLVKELVDRTPPQALPDAVIPPEEVQAPNTQVPAQNPGEAPLDPTGGQGRIPPGSPQSGAPMQPGTQVPPFPQQPRASIEFFPSKESRKDFTHSEQKALIDENLKGRARNYDKLRLEGTHYELEQESSIEDFLWG